MHANHAARRAVSTSPVSRITRRWISSAKPSAHTLASSTSATRVDPGVIDVERPRGERVEREEPVRLGIGGVAEPGDRVVDAGVPPDERDLRVAGQGAARILVDHEARGSEACEHDDAGEDPGRERVSERERAAFPDLRGSHGRSL